MVGEGAYILTNEENVKPKLLFKKKKKVQSLSFAIC